MHAERDELVKRVFPQLRKQCEARGVTWGEVDLRWGITDEQKAEGRVLSICLSEIHNCRPYFIGLLGQRYGWLTDDFPPSLIEREPWLAEYSDRSVTELEILHGVLNNPEMTSHAFFYLRDPSYIDSLPTEEQARFREGPTQEEIDLLAPHEAQRRAEQRTLKLTNLKERIRTAGFPVRENYRDYQALGDFVLADLSAVIDYLYPEESLPNPLDREAAYHEAFAASRAGVYVGRQEYFDLLDAHIKGDGAPLVLLGESGSGKSALLANWVTRSQVHVPTQGQPFVIMHFIASTPQSTDWASMLRRIMGELGRMFDIHPPLPNEPAALRLAFANLLHLVAAKGRVVLILDALNQLDDRDGALDLVWLPPEIPANVRLVLSTLPGRPLDDLEKRGWRTFTVQPLQLTERLRFISEYLGQYRKALLLSQVERIAAAGQTSNPLFLRLLLEELRVHGDHFTIDRIIDRYLAAPSLDSLYEKVLARYEADYERDRPGLVRDAAAVLCAARRGLSEAELLDLLGGTQGPLPRAHWSPMYLAMEASLVSPSGLMCFSHQYLRDAVRRRYLSREQDLRDAHLRLADYFETRDPGVRTIDELPWQLAEAKSWDRLVALLSDANFLTAAWAANKKFDINQYWTKIEHNTALRMSNVYRPFVEAPEQNPSCAFLVGRLMYDAGYLDDALALYGLLGEHLTRAGMPGAMNCFSFQGVILLRKGSVGPALDLHRYEEEAGRLLGDDSMLGRSFGNQASVLMRKGALSDALPLLKQAEDLFRQQHDFAGVANSLTMQGITLAKQGDMEGGMTLFKEAEHLSRELGDLQQLMRSLGEQAGVLESKGDWESQLTLRIEEERICRQLGDVTGLAVCLGNQAVALTRKEPADFAGAFARLEEQERITRKLGDQFLLLTCLWQRLVIRRVEGVTDAAEWTLRVASGLWKAQKDDGRLDEDMNILTEVELICRQLDDLLLLQKALFCQAQIRQTQGDLRAALALQKKNEEVCRQRVDKEALFVSLTHQTYLFEALVAVEGNQIIEELGGATRAKALCQATMELSHELGVTDVFAGKDCQAVARDHPVLLYTIAYLRESTSPIPRFERTDQEVTKLRNQSDFPEALQLLKEQEQVVRRLSVLPWLESLAQIWLTTCLLNQAIVFSASGNVDGALMALKEQERLCREFGLLRALSENLEHQGRILWDQIMLEEGLGVARERLRVCRQLDDPAALIDSLILLSAYPGEDRATAVRYLKEASDLAIQHKRFERIHEIATRTFLMNSVVIGVEEVQTRRAKKSWWEFWK
jgi:tetratricopeptide (TPR) repeat protein